MNAHRRQRLTAVLEAEGLDAIIGTTTENVYYVSGLRSISHALFRGLELYAVFTRRGTALVIPFIDTTGVASDRIQVDHVACYGKFFFEYSDDPGEIRRKIREWTRSPAPSPADALSGVLADLYPTDRALRAGDLVRFDLGCLVGPYRSDISRTAVLGKPSEKQARYYSAILAGERAAIAAMKPGVAVSQLFEIAVRITRENGLPHYQRHHVGHGIGLEPYDPPAINASTSTALEAVMVFFLETNNYQRSWGTFTHARLPTTTAGQLIACTYR